MKENTINESIFSGKSTVIPMVDVQHIEKHWYTSDKDRNKQNYRWIKIITKYTIYNSEIDDWENNIYLSKDEARDFLKAWCMYRRELENNIK